MLTDEQIKALLLEYNKILAVLRKNKIIKSNKLVAEYGEYVASRRLKLVLNKSPSHKGYDAMDAEGRKYQIKARKDMPYNIATVFPADLNKLDEVDYLVYVGFDNDWEIKELLRIPKNEVKPTKFNRIILTKHLKEKFSVSTKPA